MQYDWLGDLKHLLACPEQIETFAAQFAARVAAPQGGGAIEDRAVTAPDGSGSLTTRITALIAQFDELPEDLQDVARNFPESKALLAWLTKADSAPAQAGGGDACCLFCRTELDPDEMDDGSDLPPLAPGVCSECFQRWHDEPVWRKRLKEATDKPAQAGAGVKKVEWDKGYLSALAKNTRPLGGVDEPAQRAVGDDDPACTCASLPTFPCIKHAPAHEKAGEAVACADCAAGHPRYFVPGNGDTIHALPGGTVSHCAKPDPQSEAEREVVDAAVDFATMAAPDAEEWGTMRVARLGRLVNAVHVLRGIRAAHHSRPGGAA